MYIIEFTSRNTPGTFYFVSTASSQSEAVAEFLAQRANCTLVSIDKVNSQK